MKTLLKLFFLPRLKNIGILLSISLSLIGLALWTHQIGLILISLFLLVVFTSYITFNSNITSNIEWLRNSAYEKNELFLYYLFEQTLSVFVMGISILLGIFVVFMSIQYVNQNETFIQLLDMASLSKNNGLFNIIHPYQSSTEKALDVVFAIFFFISMVYGAELVKTYFARLHFEKKFTKEAYYFNLLIILMIFFVFVKDTNLFEQVINMKILITPLFMLVVFYAQLIAANDTFKFFRINWKEKHILVPAVIPVVLFFSSLSFSLVNFNINSDVDEAIAEHRFLWFFSPEIDNEKLKVFYSHVKNENNFKYLVDYNPHVPYSLFHQVLKNRKTLDSLTSMTSVWPLERMHEKELNNYFEKYDKLLGQESNKRTQKVHLNNLHKKNKNFWKLKSISLKSSSFETIMNDVQKNRKIREISSERKKEEPSI